MNRNMNTNMNVRMQSIQKTPAEKAASITALVFLLAAAVLFMLHKSGVMPNVFHYFALAVASLFEAFASRNVNRQVSTLQTIAAVLLFLTAILNTL